jgi:UDP-N-acetylmuramate--alanine ligase
MKVHMVGVGGIGMSALAQLYLLEGHTVTGSDREQSPTTDILEKKGMRVSVPQDADTILEDIDLVVYSDAVWEDNPERMRAKELEIKQVSYFEALGDATVGKTTIAVTGTHGKTTTTAMLAKILKDTNKKPTAIVGSIVPEFGSNFLAGNPDLFVVEGCEYKDHVLKLSPKILVITNAEWDHTDWFPSLEALQATFTKAVQALPKDGAVIANPNDPNVAPILKEATCAVIDYTKETVPELSLIGEFNKMNARAAKAAAKTFAPDISEKDIDASLAAFKGTWRRFEYKGVAKGGALIYDDYAHHPTAISVTLKAMREKFPEKHIVVAFHPHLYTRTRDLMDAFAAAFADADSVVIAPIYPAREEPIPGVTAQALAAKIAETGKPAEGFETFEEVKAFLESKDTPESILLTMGAGDIYKISDALIV